MAFPSCGAGQWKRTVGLVSSLDCIRKGLTLGSSSHPVSVENRQTDFDKWAPAVTGNHVPCVVQLSRVCNVILLIPRIGGGDTPYLGEGEEYKKEKEWFLKTGTIYILLLNAQSQTTVAVGYR